MIRRVEEHDLSSIRELIKSVPEFWHEEWHIVLCMGQLSISAHTYHYILKLSCTIADLNIIQR